MAQKVVIDVEARFQDNLTGEARSASKALDDVESSARDAAKAIDGLGKKDAEPTVDVDHSSALKKIKDTNSRLDKLGKTKTETKLSALDKATAIIDKVANKAKSFGSKTYSALVKIRDSSALSTLSNMSNKMKSFTGKAWSVAVKVKDMATAPLRGIKNMLFSMKSLVMAIGAGIATQQLVLNPINVADAYSSAKISFSTLLGDSQGQQMMDNLDQFAKATPFNTTNVIENAQKMLAMGWDAENIIKDMEVIGNAAAATGKLDVGLESIVRAMSQIKTKGRLSTEELNQLAEAGISAKAMLAEQMGYGTGDEGIAKMTEDLEKGAIASNEAIAALLAGMQKYDGMMDSMANETVEGLASQIKDAFSINIVRKWGQGLQDGAKDAFGTVVDLIDEADGALTEFGDTVYEVGKNISHWVADKFKDAVARLTEITGSFEFKNASLGEKIKMLWNGVIVDPLKEWWEGGGQQKTAETAGKIGSWIGKMLSKGLLALFGATDVLNDGIGNDAGSSIAGSFLEGFLDNFDGSAITDAFVDAISNIWGALPTWAKVLLGVFGVGKAAGGLSSLASGATNLISGISNVAGGVKSLIGGFTTSTVPIGPAYVSGSGILGAVGKAGVGLGATTTGGALLTGGLGIAGGVAGGASVIKGGLDLYNSHKAYEEGDYLESMALKTSGSAAIGGALTGAAAGAAIGSVVPVIGTALGALIGAGIGGVGGWLLGDKWADDIRATDDAVNDVTAAVQDLETEEEKLEARNKLVWQNMKDHFGDIKLSASEIQRLATQVVWGSDLANYETFTTSAQAAVANLQSLKSAAQQTDRWLWKAGLGVTFNEDEIESITASFDEYINSAKSYIENKHYEFTAAVGLLVDVESEGGKSIIESGNAFYAKYKSDLDAAGKELGDLLTESIADGFINAEEQTAIAAAQQKIADITQKLADAETAAELELIELKFGDGKLDPDSFSDFMAQIQTTLDERMTANDEAFTVSVAALQLQLREGTINREEYEQQLQTLLDGYTANVESVKADILNVELDIIGDAYAVDGVTKDKLAKALQDSLAQGIDPITWSPEQARQFLGIDSLSESSAGAIAQMLGGVADQLQLVEVNGELMLKLGVNVPGDTAAKVEQAVDQAVPGSVDEDVDVKINPRKSIKPLLLSALDLGVENTYNVSPLVNITTRLGSISPVSVPRASMVVTEQYRGGIVGGPSAMDAFARGGRTDGGIVGGSTRFIRVNEESPEMIIPLSSQRRERAMKLWTKTGELLGVDGFFRGGRTDSGAEDWADFKTRNSGGVSGGGQSVHVEVGGITIEVHVDGGDPESIAAAIREQMPEITEMVAGMFNDAFTGQFENTPVRGGAA